MKVHFSILFVCISCLICRLADAADYPLPQLVVDGADSLSGPTFTLSQGVSPSDRFVFAVSGTVDVDSPNTFQGSADINAAGVTVRTRGTARSVGDVVNQGELAFGALTIGNQELGFSQLVSANSGGLGSQSPSENLGNRTALVSALFPSASSGLPAGTVLELRVFDTVSDDNSGSFQVLPPYEETVRISEFLFNEISGNVSGEWIELVNYGPNTVDISDWKLGDEETKGAILTTEGMYEFPLGSLLQPGQAVVIAGEASTFLGSYGKKPDYEVPVASDDPSVPNLSVYSPWDPDGERINMANTADQLLLLNQNEEFVDFVGWAEPGVVFTIPGYNSPALDGSLEADGQSWYRLNPLVANQTVEEWALGSPSSPGEIAPSILVLGISSGGFLSLSVPNGGNATLTAEVAGFPRPQLQWYEGVAGDKSKPIVGQISEELVTPPLVRRNVLLAGSL